MILQWLKLTMAAVALGTALLPAGPVTDVSGGRETVLDSYALTTDQGGISVKESRFDVQGETAVKERRYELPNGDTVRFGKATAGSALDNVCVATLELPGGDGVVRWYNAGKAKWEIDILHDADVAAGCVAISTKGGEVLLYTPKVYEAVAAGTLCRKPELSGGVRIRISSGTCFIQLIAEKIPSGSSAEYTTVQSAGPLFSWDAATEKAWSACTMDNDRLWCYDGCYHPTPESYEPSGKNYYYRIPAGYFCRLVGDNAPRIRAASDLTAAMLDVMGRQQNSAGFFPTPARSGWLYTDYSIGANFYDTRFNTDLVEIFYAASWLGCKEYDAVMNRYFDFFLDYAETHRTKTESGILVYDYYNPAGGKPTHTSLNHQLAEAQALYHWSSRLGRPALMDLADRMLQGVEDTAEQWVREDGNLHYAFYPDGSYGGSDYLYLTYNDLFNLRAFRKSRAFDTSRLQLMMDSKLRWMIANNVTGYLQ